MKDAAIERCKQEFENTSQKDILFPKAKYTERMKNMRFVNTLKKCDRSQILDKLQKKNAIFDLSWMKEEEAESFQVLSEQFVKDARAFDETLKDGVEQILMEEVPGVLEVQNISSTL